MIAFGCHGSPKPASCSRGDVMNRTNPSGRSGARRLVILIPYLWLVAFFLVPFLIVLKISLSQPAIAQPPYLPVLDLSAGWAGVKEFIANLSLANYLSLAADQLYVSSYL